MTSLTRVRPGRQPRACRYTSRSDAASRSSASVTRSRTSVVSIDRPRLIIVRATVTTQRLPPTVRAFHASAMFMVTESDADAIRAAFFDEGELSAAIELRRRFPGIADNAQARQCARTIAGWKPQPAPTGMVTPLRPRARR